MSDEILDVATLTENDRQSSTDSHHTMCRVVIGSINVLSDTQNSIFATYLLLSASVEMDEIVAKCAFTPCHSKIMYAEGGAKQFKYINNRRQHLYALGL